MRVAVAGASGYVGSALIVAGAARGHEMVGLVRREDARARIVSSGGRAVVVPSLDHPSLKDALAGVDAVVHLAQISGERRGETYEAVNVQGTRALAAAARSAGASRIVLLSGLGVARYGIAPYSTNPYFLSKLAAEVEVFRSGLQTIVFRPSYIVGPGDPLMRVLLEDLERGSVPLLGDGLYRLQPIALRDALEAILDALLQRGPKVYDLVGPEPLGYAAFVARASAAAGRKGPVPFERITIEEAKAEAAAGGFRGLLPDEVDVILCDEVSDAGPLEGLLGRFLTPVDAALEAACRGARSGGRAE
jgi:NADH dehydrogenase